MNVPFSKPSIGDAEVEATKRVLLSGWLAAGAETADFEAEFSRYITPVGEEPYYCIFTNSCTSALKMAYKWAKEQGTKEFSVPKNTFCATYAAASETGCAYYWHGDSPWPRLGRVNMHYGGVKDETPCLIEDSAHRIEPNDPLVGKIRCYSFYVTKNMTTGSGGMFVTNDKEIYEKARLYWRDGLTTSTADRLGGRYDYEVKAMAGGYDGNDIAAAIGRVQLARLPDLTARRNEIRGRYNRAFGQVWDGNHLYPYFVGSTDAVADLIGYLREFGISAGYHYPGTGWLGVSLPIYPDMGATQVEYVIQKVRDWRGNKNIREEGSTGSLTG